jgi:hypothetical protein
MFRFLPPPPRFTLPPPPMFSLDWKILLQLTCSSIRKQQITNPYLILVSCVIFFLIAILLTLLFVWIQSNRLKTLSNNYKSEPISTGSISSSRFYETISSQHTGIYLESINTSATTLSTDPNSSLCHRMSSSLYYEILDI